MSSSGWEKVVILTMAFKDQKIQKKSQSSRIKKEKKAICRSVSWASLTLKNVEIAKDCLWIELQNYCVESTEKKISLSADWL